MSIAEACQLSHDEPLETIHEQQRARVGVTLTFNAHLQNALLQNAFLEATDGALIVQHLWASTVVPTGSLSGVVV